MTPLRNVLQRPFKSFQTSSRTTSSPSTVKPVTTPPPPSRPVAPVQPTSNALPTIQIGAVPNGNRTSYFIGFYRQPQPNRNQVPIIQRTATQGLGILTYTYNPSFGYTSLNPWVQQTDFYYPVEYFPYLSTLGQDSAFAPRNPVARSTQRSVAQTASGSDTPQVILYGPARDNPSNVQYTYVPLDDLIGGLRRTSSRFFGFLSRRLRRNRTSSLTADCLDCFD
ncbi:uncharacterized protein LOC100904308 [Galendromus occidentalis]|uniref:Uncharacterized protein LOC100904308 n=1 Tax=Galendromus occidentalis TaxID=34638 RepID=A0AAJ7SIA4_9ACAR|nr:uncharacterized protein LOC100904308 [Galendromus occidentalis]